MPGGEGAAELTVSVAVPLTAPLVAVIVTDPPVTPTARPVPEIVATPLLLEPHETERPDRTLPPASFSVAVNCTPPEPMFVVGFDGVTVTLATGVSVVVPAVTFERLPKTAFTLSVPRNVITWKL